jgi:hypothetical protein
MPFETEKNMSFNEFRAWLTGLILGKRGTIPDLDDWKEIKKMMDRVVAHEKDKTISFPLSPTIPPQIDRQVWLSPLWPAEDPSPYTYPSVRYTDNTQPIDNLNADNAINYTIELSTTCDVSDIKDQLELNLTSAIEAMMVGGLDGCKKA